MSVMLPRRLILSVLATLPLFGASAFAEDDHDLAREAVRTGRARPLEEIVARAQADFPGDILDAELEDEDGQYVYEIKTITANGRILKLKYDAKTGELIDVRGRHGRHGRPDRPDR